MTNPDRDALIEATVTAFRERDASGAVAFSPAWWDLSVADREAAFRLQLASRYLEQAMDPKGLSTTARAVVDRALGIAQLEE